MKILVRIAVIFLLAAGVYFLRQTNTQNTVSDEDSSQIESTEDKNTPVELEFEEDKEPEPKRAPLKPVPKTSSTSTPKVITAPISAIPEEAVDSIDIEPETPNYPINAIKVNVYEWGIDVSSMEIPSGKIVFYVVNDGSFSHNFGIWNVRSFGKVLPGESAVFEIDYLAPGSYTLYSPKRVDRERGMFQDFVVR